MLLYWYEPLRCYYAVDDMLDDATLGRCWIGDADTVSHCAATVP